MSSFLELKSSSIMHVGSKGKGHLRHFGHLSSRRGEERKKHIYPTHTLPRPQLTSSGQKTGLKAQARIGQTQFIALLIPYCMKNHSPHTEDENLGVGEFQAPSICYQKQQKTLQSPCVPLNVCYFAKHAYPRLVKYFQLQNHHSKKSDPLFHS